VAFTALSVPAADAAVVQHISNGTFDSTTTPWWSTGNTPTAVVDGRMCAEVPAGTVNPWDASLGHNDIPLVDGDPYHLEFTASASAAVTVRANVQLNEDPFTTVLSRELALTAEPQEFSFDFTGNLDSTNGTFTFQLGGSAAAYTFCLDNVVLSSDTEATPPVGGAEQLDNGDFSDGIAGWFAYGTSNPTFPGGRLCADVPGGLVNPWDAGIGQNDVRLQADTEYTFSFEASAEPGAVVRANVQLGVDPFTGYLSRAVTLTPEVQRFEYTFTATEDTEAGQVVFHVGANPEGYAFCVDNVSLLGGEEEPPYAPDTGPRVRVNQVGYLPHGPKNATIVTDATEALAWALHAGDGTVVATGTTTPRGVDAASGQNVHTVDFAGVTAAGTGYTLVADSETSHPFDIAPDVYQRLRGDALQFFYIQRSGIAIDGELVGEQYARPAGHVGVAPNTGDTDVPCQPGVCDYRLDVRGGWYDAGDHGKYVVNGGIATYQLLSSYERTKYAVTAGGGAGLGDSTLRVPERGNGVPDVLDEARWELEFLMRMQVPAGEELAGMAHHKIHDRNWTGIPMQPEDDPELRELHPPSTAATLNLAATTAQCARLYANYDAAFAAQCLASARRAWAAAQAHPDVYASGSDGNGGGAYSDDDVSDEFYWAAAQLYLTTGEAAFRDALEASPHHTGDVFTTTGFNWPATAALGRLDLATIPNGLPATDRERLRESVVDAAGDYLSTLEDEAYGLPMPGHRNNYFWGSNSNILNNIVVLATAYDLTGDTTFRDGALQGTDYLLGRNALNHSYVTGWGERSPQNQHSRIFAHQADASLPNPPAGSLAGGANAFLDDPFASGLLTGCAPQFCYVDDIASYSTNEVAINWNSALAWVASFLADQADGTAPEPAACRVTYQVHGSWSTGFTTQVTLANTGTAPIDGWTLRWAFVGAQNVTQSWSAVFATDGSTVTASNMSWNRRINPGSSVTFGFNGATSLANPTPPLFTVNGAACTG
jgi:endoglucanase